VGKITLSVRGFAIAILIVGTTYLGCVAFAAISRHYSWKEMDWNSDGTTTIVEFFASADIGVREVVRDGERCREFYALKDGMPVRTDCKQ
jgi:hypothetical protein